MKLSWLGKKKVEKEKYKTLDEQIAEIEVADVCVHDWESIDDKIDSELNNRFRDISDKYCLNMDWGNYLITIQNKIVCRDASPCLMYEYNKWGDHIDCLCDCDRSCEFNAVQLWRMRDRVCLKCGKVVRNANDLLKAEIEIYESMVRERNTKALYKKERKSLAKSWVDKMPYS